MFLVSDSPGARASKIRSWLRRDASVSLLVAAVYFEWTLSRGTLALSCRPNIEVRNDLIPVHGLEAYKDLWWREVKTLNGARRLPEIVKEWQAVTEAFDARNRLVHGRDRYTRNMASPHVEALLSAVEDVFTYCDAQGVDLNGRLRVRRSGFKRGSKQ